MTAIVLDTETTGLDREKDRVVELCVVDFKDDALIMLQRFNPGMSIPPEVTAIHGITDDDVADCPGFETVVESLKARIESAEAVIGYNVGFDQGMIDSEFSRAGVRVTWPTLVDPKRLWDVYEPREERHLQNAFRRFVDRKGFTNAHSAAADTRAVREVLINQIATFGLENIPWDALDPEKKFWWGPTSHVILHDSGELRLNFGKNRGKAVWDVDVGFWRWLTLKDFPNHLLLLALEVIQLENAAPDHRRQRILDWAIRYKAEHP